jgi:hypothetical protein
MRLRSPRTSPPSTIAELLEVSDTKSMEEGDTTDPMEMY